MRDVRVRPVTDRDMAVLDAFPDGWTYEASGGCSR